MAFLFVIGLAVGGYLLLQPVGKLAPGDALVKPPPPPTQTMPASPVVKNYSAAASLTPPKHYYTDTVIVPDVVPREASPVGKPGRLAIIIDDMGSSTQEARSLAGIGVPLTFSIIPGLPRYGEVAAFLAANGKETMIHIPMQSKDWPGRRLESNGLLVSMDDAEITERMEGFIKNLPKAIGANNHTGSEFTEHEDKMRAVLNVLKSKGLFFVDSVTTPRTVGVKLARELDIKTERRSVFLDNEQDSAYILGQLDQAIRLAKKSGGVIAICHPHPVTIRTLETALPGLAKQGITLVPASALVR